jgi:hypothetical protein
MPEAWSEEWQRVGAEDATLLDAARKLRVQVFASGPLMEVSAGRGRAVQRRY